MTHFSANETPTSPPAYLEALERLVTDCAVIVGAPQQDAVLSALAVSLASLPAMADWRGRSQLCRDGAPVEIALHVGDRQRAPSVTLDPFLSLEGAETPLSRAALLASLARPTVASSVENMRRVLVEHSSRTTIRAAWLGLSLEPTCRNVRLYVDYSGAQRSNGFALSFRAPRESSESLPQGLANIGEAIAVDFSAGGLLTRVASFGRFRILALDFSDAEGLPVGATGAKASFALSHANNDILCALVGICGFKPEALLTYVRQLLGRGNSWRDRRCGVAVAIPRGGARPSALTFYHPLGPYLGNDDAIRVALARIARSLGWELSTFSALARLVADTRNHSAFHLAGFTLSADGAAGVTLYAGTGHVAR